MRRASHFPLDKEKLLLARNLSGAEVRLAVANYYAEQAMRKRADMQIRHLGDKELNPVLQYSADVHAEWEGIQEKVMLEYARAHPIGRWMLNQTGVGPVIAAGLLAHLPVGGIPETVGHWWSFAGLNPAQKWEKGEKRPYNPHLKQLTYHLGECVKRASGSENSYYGPLYKEQKEILVKRNDAGGFKEKSEVFVMKEPARQKAVRASGKVPPFYLDRMACRWVAKIFLSHVHALWYWTENHRAPPKPFAIAILGHAHEIAIPNTDLFPGFVEAYYKL